MNGTMQYLTALGLDPEDPVFLVLAYCLSSPSLGILTRQGFVDGWRRLGYLHCNALSDDRCDTLQSMAGKVNELREQAKIDNEFHKRVYLFTYAFARPEGQRALRMFLIFVSLTVQHLTWRLNIGNFCSEIGIRT